LDSKSRKNRKTLRYSFREGLFASGMLGFTQDFFTPFLLFLGGTARQVGLLSALPNLFASMVQLKSPDFVRSLRSRKKIINAFVFLQGLTVLFIAGTAIFGILSAPALIGLVALFTGFGALALPAWSSLMGDLIAAERRGEYFGWRNKVLGLITVAFAFLAGLLLHYAKGINLLWGFALVFGLAFIFRMGSLFYLSKMHEPGVDHDGDGGESIFKFLAGARKDNYAKFVLYVSVMYFAVYLSGPFFSVFMLKDLGFSYVLYITVTVTATLAMYLAMQRWGVHADRVGNLKVLKTSSRFIVFIPLLWVLYREPWFLLFAQVFSGFFWAGFMISSMNFIYDCTPPEKRTRCIAFFNALTGIGLCAGALTGGLILKVLPPLFGHPILTLFVISSALRFVIAFFLPFKLREVRQVEKINGDRLVWSVLGIKRIGGLERRPES